MDLTVNDPGPVTDEVIDQRTPTAVYRLVDGVYVAEADALLPEQDWCEHHDAPQDIVESGTEALRETQLSSALAEQYAVYRLACGHSVAVPLLPAWDDHAHVPSDLSDL